jgi:nucleotide-binding universal stress UspA family protein
MLSLLLPVDGSGGSDRAVHVAIKLYRDVAPVRIHLLHVLAPDDGIALQSTRFSEAGEKPGDSNRCLSSARSLLDEAEIPYVSHVRGGFVPAAIVEHGRVTHCDVIVMGTRGMGTTDALLGSIARQVIQLADIPVTLVK